MGDGEEVFPERLRLFTGIPLTEEVRRYVAGIAGDLAEEVEGVRWVQTGNLHVTLKFLGGCDASRITDLVDVLKVAAEELPFDLRVGGVGAFPSQGCARVIWVGAEDPEKKIDRVYSCIESGTERLGFKKERRPYRPHITVGRARKKPVRLSEELLRGFETSTILEVKEIALYRSILSSSGARYSILERAGL